MSAEPDMHKLVLLVRCALPYVEKQLAAQGDRADPILVALQHEMARVAYPNQARVVSPEEACAQGRHHWQWMGDRISGETTGRFCSDCGNIERMEERG